LFSAQDYFPSQMLKAQETISVSSAPSGRTTTGRPSGAVVVVAIVLNIVILIVSCGISHIYIYYSTDYFFVNLQIFAFSYGTTSNRKRFDLFSKKFF
jgi:hypothetical protein